MLRSEAGDRLAGSVRGSAATAAIFLVPQLLAASVNGIGKKCMSHLPMYIACLISEHKGAQVKVVRGCTGGARYAQITQFRNRSLVDLGKMVAELCWKTMPNRALTTLAFDRAGNAYQVVYPSAPAYNNTAFPLSTPDTCAFELIPHRVFVGGFTTAVFLVPQLLAASVNGIGKKCMSHLPMYIACLISEHKGAQVKVVRGCTGGARYAQITQFRNRSLVDLGKMV
ncbi:hypothetical protein Tcan_10609 [Toxocara canis]|uniref:Uncharacterized protein n=1 Tax=Toxocara canis TaxID=6265 RepID=A0A0B2UV51_TOXCA|nr:hypothetical protein Tcan_10609 [Toxocara canis]